MFDLRRTIDELKALTGVSWSSCQQILTEELHVKRVATKFVPRLLSEDQRTNRLDVCREMKDQLKSDPDFLSKIITGDESWCYGYDPDTKQQSSQWISASSPRPKKARQVKSNVKTMLIFFDIKGLVHFQFVPQGQTVKQLFYLEELERLHDAVQRKRPKLWRSGELLLHQDNAPAHTALSLRQFLTKNGITTASHPPYSPDLSPCHFFLFPRMKRDLK